MMKAKYTDIATIAQTAQRCKAEGIPVGDKTIRRWVRDGQLPVVYTGKKALVSWDNLIDFLTCSR